MRFFEVRPTGMAPPPSFLLTPATRGILSAVALGVTGDPWSALTQCTSLERLDLLLLLLFAPHESAMSTTIGKCYVPMLKHTAAPVQTVVLRAAPEEHRPVPPLEKAVLVPDDVRLLDAVFQRANLARTRVVFDYSGVDPPLTCSQLEGMRESLRECLPFVAGGERLLVTDAAYV